MKQPELREMTELENKIMAVLLEVRSAEPPLYIDPYLDRLLALIKKHVELAHESGIQIGKYHETKSH